MRNAKERIYRPPLYVAPSDLDSNPPRTRIRSPTRDTAAANPRFERGSKRERGSRRRSRGRQPARRPQFTRREDQTIFLSPVYSAQTRICIRARFTNGNRAAREGIPLVFSFFKTIITAFSISKELCESHRDSPDSDKSRASIATLASPRGSFNTSRREYR